MQYIFDNNGEKSSVILPYNDWVKFNNNYLKLQNKLKILYSIQNGLYEVKQSQKNKENLQTLSDFLNEK